MKKTLMAVLSVCLLASCGSAQTAKGRTAGKSEKEIPPVVDTAFTRDYPNVKDVDWEKEGDKYEAEFETGDTEISVVYNASGVIQETETEIEPAQLPKAIQDYIATNHAEQKIKEAAKIVYPDGSVKYETEVKGKDLIFDENGNLVKTIGE